MPDSSKSALSLSPGKKDINNTSKKLPNQASALFQSLFKCFQDGVLIANAGTGEILVANPFFLSMTGYPHEEVTGKKLWETACLSRIVPDQKNFDKLRQEKMVRRDRQTLVTSSGSLLDVEFICHSFNVLDQAMVCFTLRDITERVEMENKMMYLSHHDTLTGLYNRNYFEEELRRLENSRQHPISVFVLDMDNLKKVNDQYGHAAGDALLKCVAQVLLTCFRDEDILSRIGGDEFAILLPKTNAEATEKIQQRMERTLKHFNHHHPEIPLNLSIGAATSDGQKPLVEVLHEADDIMYQKKRARANHA